MNSQVTFEEYFVLAAKHFLYEATYNPNVVYEFELQGLEPGHPEYAERAPEMVIQGEAFRASVLEEFQLEVHDALLEKRWFSKVEAIENFTDYWSYGRGVTAAEHQPMYVPVSNNILPRPKFRDYSKQDQVGREFSYRRPGVHTPAAHEPPSSLKPVPVYPIPGLKEDYTAHYVDDKYRVAPRKVWHGHKRLGKNKRTLHLSNARGTHSRWRFSTFVDQGKASSRPQHATEPETTPSMFVQLYTYAKAFSQQNK